MSLTLTLASYFVAPVALYYAALFAISWWGRSPSGDDPGLAFVIFVAALNEERVLRATLENLLVLDYARVVVCVGNDGSTDGTKAILDGFARDPRVIALHRQPPAARRGKSDVLNACFAKTCELVASNHPVLGGTDPDRVVVGIVDADGRLDAHTLRTVAPYFADPDVAGVQIGVRIANARSGLLTRMQDMEFVGFSAFVQRARDRLGSVGLGGNGQFTRLSALIDLHGSRGGPWRLDALTEDLELGLALICRGWRSRFCLDAFVAQQGLPRWRALLRQRTRWIQGHYTCWRYVLPLLRAPAPWPTRIDLTLYLVLVVTVIAMTASALLSMLVLVGVLSATNGFLGFIPDEADRRLVDLAFGLIPVTIFMYVYQRRATARFHLWELPAMAAVFTAYTYVWAIATVRALGRIALGRDNWVKTPRVTEEPVPEATPTLQAAE